MSTDEGFRTGAAMRGFMTLMWLVVGVAPFIADFNETHLLNPDWPPHARLHMMTMLTSSVALAAFGLYLCWGPAMSRLQSLKLSAVLGTLYAIGLVVACVTGPMYGGGMNWADQVPTGASLSNGNFTAFVGIAFVFALLTVVMHTRSANKGAVPS